MSSLVEWIDFSGSSEWLKFFNEVFSSEMSEHYLKWKYNNVQKMGSAIREDGKLVAFYGGMQRNILYKGKVINGVQIGDVMVHPSQRGAFTRKGAFWRVACEYIESMIGKDKQFAIAFGFPNRRAYMLGKRLELYDAVDSLVELVWAKESSIKFSLYRGREWNSSDFKYVEKIWQNMALSLNQSLLGVRDEGWLRHRYIEHPDSPYKIVCVHPIWSKKPQGILILRDRAQQGMELLDVIGDVKLMREFCAVAQNYSRKFLSNRLFCWITQSHVSFFKEATPQIHDIDIVIPFITPNAVIDQDSVKNHWWLMAGDTDFR